MNSTNYFIKVSIGFYEGCHKNTYFSIKRTISRNDWQAEIETKFKKLYPSKKEALKAAIDFIDNQNN